MLYGEEYAIEFKESWVPLIYIVTKIGTIFNWGDILSTSLEQAISTTKNTTLGMHVTLYMTSYPLDTIYVIISFPSMGW
jgi:hypothetical protein